MKKAVVGTVLGAVVFYVWGALSWMVIPWHDAAIRPLPQEQLVSDTLKTVVKDPGLYMFPHAVDAQGNRDQAAWAARYQAGPIGWLIFSPEGKPPMSPAVFVRGFVNALAIAALLMWILWASRLARTVHRIHLAAAVGLIAGLAVHVSHWNWLGFPAAFTIVGVLDLLAGFILMGAAQSKFVPSASIPVA